MRPHNALVDDTELRRLVARSMGHKQIAKHFHCSPITVRKRLRSLRLVAPTDAAGKQGQPLRSAEGSPPAVVRFCQLTRHFDVHQRQTGREAMTDRQPPPGVHENFAAELMEQAEPCPICDQLFKPDDLCATDIEFGTCHAACLEGSTVVDLETREPLAEGSKVATYRYEDAASPACEQHSAASTLAKALQEQLDACDCDDCEMCHRHRAILAQATPAPESHVTGKSFPYSREVLEQALEYLAKDAETDPAHIVEQAFAFVGKIVPQSTAVATSPVLNLEVTDAAVFALAEVLLGMVNAPENVIYRAARKGLEAAIHAAPAPQSREVGE